MLLPSPQILQNRHNIPRHLTLPHHIHVCPCLLLPFHMPTAGTCTKHSIKRCKLPRLLNESLQPKLGSIFCPPTRSHTDVIQQVENIFLVHRIVSHQKPEKYGEMPAQEGCIGCISPFTSLG